jgi:hypothetical protein
MKRTLPTCSFHSRTTERKMRSLGTPSEYIIRNILNYSKALEVIKTEKGGIVNIVMN